MRSIKVVETFCFEKNYVTDLLSVMMMNGCGDLQNILPNSSNAKYIATNSLAQLDICICEVLNVVLEPYATGVLVLRVDVTF